MQKLKEMIEAWCKDLTWVGNTPNMFLQKTYRLDQGLRRQNVLEIIATIEDKTILVNGKAEPLALSKGIVTEQYNPFTNEIPQSEIDRMKQELENFTSKVIKTREAQLANWNHAAYKVETTDPLSMK